MMPACMSLIVIQKLVLDDLMPSLDFLKINDALASINEKLKASIGTVKLAASMHTTANNYFQDVNSVLGRWFSLKATSKTLK